jgi:DNA polymerase-3 subunit gamma/tau
LRAPADTARAAPPRADATAAPAQPLPTPAEWPAFIASLKLTGMAAQLAAQTELKSVAGNVLTLALPTAHKHLADKAYADKLKVALEAIIGRKVLLAFEVGEATDASLAAQQQRERAEAKAKGEQAFRDEPFVRDLLARFDGPRQDRDRRAAARTPSSNSSSQDPAP